jgi:hypothetical protein
MIDQTSATRSVFPLEVFSAQPQTINQDIAAQQVRLVMASAPLIIQVRILLFIAQIERYLLI